MSAPAGTQLLIEVSEADADEAVLETLTTQLRDELLELDVDTVERPSSGAAPPGTRAVDLAMAAALLVTLRQGVEAVNGIISTLREWAARAPERSVRITLGDDSIELTGVTAADQQRLIEDWIQRHIQTDGDTAG